MNTLRVLHRWVGVLLAVVIFAVAASGFLLLLRGPYERWVYPALRAPVTSEHTAARAAVLSAIEARWPREGVQSVRFPRGGSNAYVVRLLDGSQALVHPITGAVIDRWRPLERLPTAVFELHAHLLTRRAGTSLNGLVGVAIVFLIGTGLPLWWPGRSRAFSLRHAVPGSTRRADLLRAHIAAGVLMAVPVLLFVLTGIGMAFYEPVARVVSRAFDARPPVEPDVRVAPQAGPARSWSDLLSAVDGAFPDGDTVFYYPGTADNARRLFRTRLPGEWHPNGRSYVGVDPYTTDVVQTIDARRQGIGTRAMHAVYPLHAAEVGGAAMTVLGACAALGLSWLAISGAWCCLGRLVARRISSVSPATPRQSDRPQPRSC